MANTRVQIEAEDWVRTVWMQEKFNQSFFRERVRLRPGGTFDFDAVSADRKIIASISTSGGSTATGKYATGKIHKIRSDMLFLLMAEAEKKLLIFTEQSMFDAILKEKDNGRIPENIEFMVAGLPLEIAGRIAEARETASLEVSPNRSKSSL